MVPQTADDLFDLDPDDPRTPSQQIANALRAAILTDRLAAGDRLPSQNDLCRRYRVARETVKSALRVLDRDGLIVSRQGSGSFVRSRRRSPIDLRELLRSAFDRPHVTIDYAGFRGETLANVLPDALDQIRTGRTRVRSIRLRLLLVDPEASIAFPRPVDPDADADAVRAVLAPITADAVGRITETLAALTAARLVESASVQTRVHPLGPAFKAYLLNDERVLFGFYPQTLSSITVDDRPVELHHPSGWDGTLFGAGDGTELTLGGERGGPPFTEQARAWFESIWTHLGQEYAPSGRRPPGRAGLPQIG